MVKLPATGSVADTGGGGDGGLAETGKAMGGEDGIRNPKIQQLIRALKPRQS